MAERSLDFRVLYKGRRKADFSTDADPDNIAALEEKLKGWLRGQGWHEGLWPSFEAEVRFAGTGKVRKRVRT